jgi:hypothetical protein
MPENTMTEMAQSIGQIHANRLDSLMTYFLEIMSEEEEDQLNLSLNGMTFNVYLRCQACNSPLARPVIVLSQMPNTAFIVDPDCKSNIEMDEDDETEDDEE